MTTAVIVADTHLSPRTPEAEANLGAVARHALEVGARMVIHLGDLTVDGAREPEELTRARRVLDDLPVPWRAIPGNHDIGDSRESSGEPAVTAGRRERWLAAVGPDWWVEEVGSWTLVGIDAQLFGSGLAAEDEQWEWLTARLEAQDPERPVVLFSHKPVAAAPDELAAAPWHRFVPAPARDRLSGLLDGRRVPLVLSGHVHQYRVLEDSARRHVWAPSSWGVLPDDIQPVIGLKRCGALGLELADSGSVRAELVEPEGLAQLVLGRDVPSPYAH